MNRYDEASNRAIPQNDGSGPTQCFPLCLPFQVEDCRLFAFGFTDLHCDCCSRLLIPIWDHSDGTWSEVA